MRKLLIACVFALLATACNQKQIVSDVPTDTLPTSKINLESLIDSIDLDMDISQLSVSDLYVLRHAFDARKGYPFRDAYLRHMYQSTTWYDSLMFEFDCNGDNFDQVESNETMSWRDEYYSAIKPSAIAYTAEEQAFIDRVKAREDELLKLNFEVQEGQRVNVGNIINPAQLQTVEDVVMEKLSQNGFAIVPAEHLQLFHVYEENDYHEFPSFITTDLYLQLFHLYFDAMLRNAEQTAFYKLTDQLCQKVLAEMEKRRNDPALTDAAEWNITYFIIAQSLLHPSGRPAKGFPEKYRAMGEHEVMCARDAKNDLSEFLDYTDAMFEYSLFRPRGHYTRNDQLKQYFQTMMWLQSAPFQTDHRNHIVRALLMADVIGSSAQLSSIYKNITEPLTFLMGEPDNVSIMQVYELLKKTGMTLSQVLADAATFDRLCKQIEQMCEQQTRIRPKHLTTSRHKLRLMPQRYQPDAEVLQEMVDYKTDPTKRATPRGLDVLAAMGCPAAEKILIDELDEANRWDQYKPNLQRMKERMDSVNWQSNVSAQWMDALVSITQHPEGAPYFMLTPEWDRKDLNAALASWAELKHDAILYAKQPMGAECGGGGVPDPVVKGYVEPNVNFWRKAIELLRKTTNLFNTYGLSNNRTESISECMEEELAFLLMVSEEELAGKPISEMVYDQLKHIGATFENMSLEMLRDEGIDLWEWNDVQGPERSVALVADVYTANAKNNPKASILYEGVGAADEIYVVIEVDGYLYLMRGAVFSYREFTRPYGEQRMNDEEWQKRLESDPRQGVPQWMEPIIAPVKQAPVDNENVFYSSGC